MTRRLLPLVLAAACTTSTSTDTSDSGDTGLSGDLAAKVGLYSVDKEQVAADCNSWTAPEFPLQFFRIVATSDGQALEYHACRLQDDCDDFDVEDRRFEPDGEYFTAISYSSFYNSDAQVCVWGAQRSSIEDRARGGVRLLVEETEQQSQDPSLANERACDEGISDWNPSFPPNGVVDCRRVDGKRIGD